MILLRDTTEIIDSVIIDTPTGGVEKGDLVLVPGGGSLYGFAFSKATLDTSDRDHYAEQVTLVTEARQVSYSKASGSGSPTFDQGDTVYVTVATGNAAATSGTGKIKTGYVKELGGVTESDTEFLGYFSGRLGV